MKENTLPVYDLTVILSNFRFKGTIASVIPYGSGHINDTFKLKNTHPNLPDYLLQRVNHHVFRNVPGLMQNVQLVINHLKQKLTDVPEANPDKEVLTLVPTLNEANFYQDAQGNYWRMCHFLKDTSSYSLVRTSQQAYEGGRAFGKFQALLSDLDVTQLIETIPHFHNIEKRLNRLKEVIQTNPVGRAKEIHPEMEFVCERVQSMSRILNDGKAGRLPFRITHNDTKFNNVLLDRNDRAQCVIDLDTVMPGHVAYDFGDAIRTIVNTAPEDEKNLANIRVNLTLFKYFTGGFLQETIQFLTDAEIRSLTMGVFLLPYIMGVRFLTDFIEGDTYYKIHFPEHNLQRARAQFQLVKKLEEVSSEMEDTVHQLAEFYQTSMISEKL